MIWWGRVALASVVAVGGLPGMAMASVEVDMLLDKLVDKGVLTRQEASELKGEMAEYKDAGNKQLAKEIVPKWAQHISWSGDLRLRQESFKRDPSTSNPETRHRQRARFRLGVKGKVSDQLEAGARLATGTNLDPVSTNQSFQDAFDKKDLFVDLAYLKFTTAGLSGWEAAPITVWGGKFENPFYSTSMVWDGDLTPEGMAASLTPKVGPVEFFATGGVFPIDELGANGGDPTLWGGQTGLAWTVAKDAQPEWLNALTLKGGVSYYDYANLENGLDVFTNSTFGNSGTAAGNVYRPANGLDFDEVNLLGELNTRLLGRPVRLHADYVKNAAIADNDEGRQAGVLVGKADRPLGWEAGYFYQKLEPNAVLGLFADSDFGDGGTNRSGHVYYATLGTLKNSALGFKWFVTEEITGPDAAIDRLQVDWVTKF
jgi:hypothetical protein